VHGDGRFDSCSLYFFGAIPEGTVAVGKDCNTGAIPEATRLRMREAAPNEKRAGFKKGVREEVIRRSPWWKNPRPVGFDSQTLYDSKCYGCMFFG